MKTPDSTSSKNPEGQLVNNDIPTLSSRNLAGCSDRARRVIVVDIRKGWLVIMTRQPG